MTRLQAVFSLITKAEVIADVGCDHGIVAEYCLKNGLCGKVIASDISGSCLNKARDRLGNDERVTFFECDGIKYDCDEAIIAGMGGRNIIDILQHASELPEKLVLCPHRDADCVRRAINDLGYAINKEILVKERGKFYFVMQAEKSREKQVLSEQMYSFGLNFDKKCELMKEYLDIMYNTYNKAPGQNSQKLNSVLDALKFQNTL